MKKHNMFIHYSEKCMEERRERQKITTAFSMHSFEGGHVFVKDPVAVEFARRDYYEGSNASTGIGPVHLIPDSEAWTKTFKEKKVLYGKANRIAPGGRTPGIDPETAKKIVRKDTDLEPVFHFCLPWQFFFDVFKGLSARTITALCVGDGSAAMAAMVLGKPFMGMCLSETHRDMLNTRLGNMVFTGFWQEGGPFYDPRIAKELQEAGLAGAARAAEEEVPRPAPKAGARAKPGPPPPPKAGAKAKAKSRTSGEGLPTKNKNTHTHTKKEEQRQRGRGATPKEAEDGGQSLGGGEDEGSLGGFGSGCPRRCGRRHRGGGGGGRLRWRR